MEIGAKIKTARLQAGMTQEQAAEALGVSRQTVSNWETEKTYPDIVNVVKMSDLYSVSLDSLLKEETPMSKYMEYLEESTNTVKSQDRLAKIILFAVYLGIWVFTVLVFYFFSSGSDAMGYALIYFWILLPVSTFVISLVIGKNNYWGEGKWLMTFGFGVMYMLADYATFQAANMTAFHKFNLPQFGMIPAGVMISLLGMGVGLVIRRRRGKVS